MYGAVVSDGPLLLSGALGLTVSVLLAWRMRRLGARSSLRVRSLLAVSYASVCPLVLLLPSQGGAALAVVDLLWFGPQLLLAARGSNLRGLSGSAQLLNAAVNAAWVVYTVAVGHPAAGAWSAVTVATSGYLLLRVRSSCREERERREVGYRPEDD